MKCNYHKNNNSPQHLSLVICCLSLSQLAPYLCLRRHVQFNLTKGERLKPRNVLGITGTSNLISVIYCVQKPDTGWQRDIDERRLMSQEITVRGLFSPPLHLLSAWISSDSPLYVKGIPQLTWDKYSSHDTLPFLGSFSLHIYQLKIERGGCAFALC